MSKDLEKEFNVLVEALNKIYQHAYDDSTPLEDIVADFDNMRDIAQKALSETLIDSYPRTINEMDTIITDGFLEQIKDKFMAYEGVRRSGVTNMFDRQMVCDLANLTKKEYLDIHENYNIYHEKFIGARSEQVEPKENDE